MHSPQIVVELRDLPPENGWACYERTGRACVVCPCGLDTGFIDKSAAIDAYRGHVPAGQKISITLGGGDEQMRDTIRRIVQNR